MNSRDCYEPILHNNSAIIDEAIANYILFTNTQEKLPNDRRIQYKMLCRRGVDDCLK